MKKVYIKHVGGEDNQVNFYFEFDGKILEVTTTAKVYSFRSNVYPGTMPPSICQLPTVELSEEIVLRFFAIAVILKDAEPEIGTMREQALQRITAIQLQSLVKVV